MRSFRKEKFFPLAVILLLLFSLVGCGAPKASEQGSGGYTVTDARGKKVKLKEKPSRIVTFDMYTGQIAMGLVKTERLAGVSYLLEDPSVSSVTDKAKRIAHKVKSPSTEELLSWRPDCLILSQWISPEVITAYEELGIPVVVTNKAENYKEVRECISLIAASVGEKEKGEKMLAAMDKKLAEIKEKTAKIPAAKKKRILLLSLMNNYGGIGSNFDDMCEFAGVTNTLREVGLKNGQPLSKELMLKCNPELILLPDYDGGGTYDTQKYIDFYVKDEALAPIEAIKNGALVKARDRYIYNCSQDYVFGVQEIAYRAYGDEFKLGDNEHISFSGE